MYYVEFSSRAYREINKLDYYSKLMVINWIEKNLEGSEDPRSIGKPLIKGQRNKWIYKIGEYRLLCKIEGNRLIMLF